MLSLERYPYHIQIDLAGIPVWLKLQYAEAYGYFGSFCLDNSGADEDSCIDNSGTCRELSVKRDEICLSEDDWSLLKKHGFARCGQVEASFLTSFCSDYLLHYNRCIIHAAAFRNSRKAWIIAADPGVGKSTQIRTLQELYPGAFSVICGDRPVLELSEDGDVIVHPSPWNGKEFWGGADAAPLAGIICLSRGESDSVTPVKPKHAALPVYRSLIHTAIDEETIHIAASFADELLHRVPVWNFINRDIPGSTRLLYQEVLAEDSK